MSNNNNTNDYNEREARVLEPYNQVHRTCGVISLFITEFKVVAYLYDIALTQIL